MSRFRPYWLLLRLFVYLCAQAGVLALYAYVTIKAGYGEMGTLTLTRFLREDGITEWIEVGLVWTCVLAGIGAFRSGQPAIHRLFPLLMGVPLFRELDDIIEELLWKDAHHIGMGVMEFLALVVIWTHRKQILNEIPAFLQRPAFYYMLFGLTLVTVFGQILGQRDIWKGLAPENSRLAKRFIEEGMEMMGYFSILIGIVEERIFQRRVPAEPPADLATETTG